MSPCVYSIRCVRSKASSQSHYEVLGLRPNASKKQIRDAFIRLSKQVFIFDYYIKIVFKTGLLLNVNKFGLIDL